MSTKPELPISQAAALQQQTSEVLELELNQRDLFYHAELNHQPLLLQTWFSATPLLEHVCFLQRKRYVLSPHVNLKMQPLELMFFQPLAPNYACKHPFQGSLKEENLNHSYC